MTDYTDPSTIDVYEVIANVNHDFKMRGHTWTDRRSWPNVTVKAMADEIDRLRSHIVELVGEKMMTKLQDGSFSNPPAESQDIYAVVSKSGRNIEASFESLRKATSALGRIDSNHPKGAPHRVVALVPVESNKSSIFASCPECGTSEPPCPGTVRRPEGCVWFASSDEADERPDTDSARLRVIADWLDTVDKLALMSEFVGGENDGLKLADIAPGFFEGNSMQEDLRELADRLDFFDD